MSSSTEPTGKSNEKSPSESVVLMTEVVLPSDCNSIGNVFGSKVMSWIDTAGAIAAGRHSRKVVVTASMDAIHFLAPVRAGYIVHIRASVNFASRTSMEVGVRVDSEHPTSGEITHTATAYSTFVALDEKGRPTEVPKVLIQNTEDQRRHDCAVLRREYRMQLLEELKMEARINKK